MKTQKKVKIKNKIAVFIIVIVLLIFIVVKFNISKEDTKSSTNVTQMSKVNEEEKANLKGKVSLDWKLTLVNFNNKLPDDYKIELSSIDQYRKFDSRAIKYLENMIETMREEGIANIWVQSSYRSVEEQQNVYNSKVQYYIEQGNSKKQAEILAQKIVNKPGYSEHNLGLAVDFNYVDNTFEQTKAFEWLKENAQDYGFILRYPQEKESITKVTYEPWHWRYVGKENARMIKELGMCLEEYIDIIN